MKSRTQNRRRLAIVTEDPARIGESGAVVIVDPDEADELGAFEETALSPKDAWESESSPMKSQEGRRSPDTNG